MQRVRLTSPEHIQVKNPSQARSDFEETQILVYKEKVALLSTCTDCNVINIFRARDKRRSGRPQNKQRGEKVTGRSEAEKQMVELNQVCKAGGRITLLLVTGTGMLKLKGPWVVPL